MRRYFNTASKPLSTDDPNPAPSLMRVFRTLRKGLLEVLSRTRKWNADAKELLKNKAGIHQLQRCLGASALGVVNSPSVQEMLDRIDAHRAWEQAASSIGSVSEEDENAKMSEDDFVQFCAEGRAIGVSVQVMRPVLARLQDAQRWINEVCVSE